VGRDRSLKRRKPRRQELHRVLLYCEGKNTEPDYFQGVRADLRGIPVRICLGTAHGEPLALVREAVKHQVRAPHCRADQFTGYDEVWCVMDVEAPQRHPTLEPALALAREEGVKVALSNPCFELWILLHLQEVTGYRTSEQAQKLLEESATCGYSARGKKLDYDHLRSLQALACERAMKLRRDPGRTYLSNPWTDVDQLVEGLFLMKQQAQN
jgi:RloB-like protein